MSYCDWVTERVRATGLQDTDLARLMGVSRQAVNRRMRGQTLWTLPDLEAINCALPDDQQLRWPTAAEYETWTNDGCVAVSEKQNLKRARSKPVLDVSALPPGYSVDRQNRVVASRAAVADRRNLISAALANRLDVPEIVQAVKDGGHNVRGVVQLVKNDIRVLRRELVREMRGQGMTFEEISSALVSRGIIVTERTIRSDLRVSDNDAVNGTVTGNHRSAPTMAVAA